MSSRAGSTNLIATYARQFDLGDLWLDMLPGCRLFLPRLFIIGVARTSPLDFRAVQEQRISFGATRCKKKFIACRILVWPSGSSNGIIQAVLRFHPCLDGPARACIHAPTSHGMGCLLLALNPCWCECCCCAVFSPIAGDKVSSMLNPVILSIFS